MAALEDGLDAEANLREGQDERDSVLMHRVCELFVLKPRERAAMRRQWLAAMSDDWKPAVRPFRARYPKLAALDAEFLDGVPASSRWWSKTLDTANYLVARHGIQAAIRSENASLLGKARCLLMFMVGLVALVVSVYCLWDSYAFLSVYKATQAALTADPKLSFSDGGGMLDRTARPETYVEYTFTVNGCRYHGSHRLLGDEAREFVEAHSLQFGSLPTRGVMAPSSLDPSGRILLPAFPSQEITVFYDRNNPSRNRATLPEPIWFWFGLAFGLVLSLFPKWFES